MGEESRPSCCSQLPAVSTLRTLGRKEAFVTKSFITQTELTSIAFSRTSLTLWYTQNDHFECTTVPHSHRVQHKDHTTRMRTAVKNLFSLLPWSESNAGLKCGCHNRGWTLMFSEPPSSSFTPVTMMARLVTERDQVARRRRQRMVVTEIQ